MLFDGTENIRVVLLLLLFAFFEHVYGTDTDKNDSTTTGRCPSQAQMSEKKTTRIVEGQRCIKKMLEKWQKLRQQSEMKT